MEAAAQERELQLLQGSSWPFHATMEASWDASSSSSSGAGDCFLLSWEPPLGCLGVLAAAAGADVHGLFPLYMESSLASLPPAPPPQPQPQDPVALPEELDDLLLNFWDASSYDDDDFASNKQQQQQQQVAFNSSCILQEKTSSTVTTNSSSFFCDDDDLLGSIFSTGPTLAEKEVFQASAEPLLSASSSNCQADPQVSDVSGAQPQATPTQGGARAPPCQARSLSSSLKRATPEGAARELVSSRVSSTRHARTQSTSLIISICLDRNLRVFAL
ncbi:hypothetical protein ABZP36_035438 [Zizania latifolia]